MTMSRYCARTPMAPCARGPRSSCRASTSPARKAWKNCGPRFPLASISSWRESGEEACARTGGAEGLRTDAEAAGVDLYVHAPYIINLASPNNRVRIPSRKILQQTCDAATEIGARAVIVHGGHVTEDDEPGAGFQRGRKGIDTVETEVPMDEGVEIGVFAPTEQGGELSEPLYVQMHRIRSGEQTITVTVPRQPVLAGIDPYHLLDWEERADDDNIEGVEVKS